MKSMLIIGLGDFGHHLCHRLVNMKNEVMIVDQNEDHLEDLQEIAANVLIADCTNKSTLEQVGVSNFDVCFVCVGSDFKNNLIIVNNLKELGARYIVSQTDDIMLEKFLLNNGADEVVHPNKEAAIRAAVKYSSEHIFDYLNLKEGYSIYEITPLRQWLDQSIENSRIRKDYDTYIIGVIHSSGKTDYMPKPQMKILSTDRLLILTNEKNMEKLLKYLEP